jgi:hypothetical protein
MAELAITGFCCLFNDAVSGSDHIRWNDRINEMGRMCKQWCLI